MRELSGQAEPAEPRSPAPPLHDWLVDWIDQDGDVVSDLDSLPGVLAHLTDAWERRPARNIVLLHYADLSADLEDEMHRLADRLGIEVPDQVWPSLVEAATFTTMRQRAEHLAPDPSGVMRSRPAFFREGRSGAGRDLLSEAELARYHERAARLAPPDLLDWLHR